MSHLKVKSNLGIVISKQCISDFRYVFISNLICDMNLISSAGSFGAGFSFPLYLYPNQAIEGVFKENNSKPTLHNAILEQLAVKLGLGYTNEKEET